MSFIVHLESTTPFGGDDRGIPFAGDDPNEGGDQTDSLDRRLGRKVDNHGGGAGDSDSKEGDASGQEGQDDTWNSFEIRDRRRTTASESQDVQYRPVDLGKGTVQLAVGADVVFPNFPVGGA